jgi:hypothetical protein
VSPDTIAVGIFSIAGTLLGVVVGLFAERWLRSRGQVSCATEPLRWTFCYRDTRGEEYGFRTSTMTRLGPIGRGHVAQATRVEYRFRADFYNGRDLPAALRSFEILFYRPEYHPMIHDGPRDERTRRHRRGEDVGLTFSDVDALEVLNLPPKQLVGFEISGVVPDPTRLAGCDRVEMRALFPDGTPFLRELARLDPSVVMVG